MESKILVCTVLLCNPVVVTKFVHARKFFKCEADKIAECRKEKQIAFAVKECDNHKLQFNCPLNVRSRMTENNGGGRKLVLELNRTSSELLKNK